jgi:hypothetical protein
MKGKHFVVFGFLLVVLFAQIGCSGSSAVGLEPEFVEDYFIKACDINGETTPFKVDIHPCNIEIDRKTRNAWYYSGIVPTYQNIYGMKIPNEIELYAIYDIKAGYIDFIYKTIDDEPNHNTYIRSSTKVFPNDIPQGVTKPIELTEKKRSKSLPADEQLIEQIVKMHILDSYDVVTERNYDGATKHNQITEVIVSDVKKHDTRKSPLSVLSMETNYAGKMDVYMDVGIASKYAPLWLHYTFYLTYYHPEQIFTFNYRNEETGFDNYGDTTIYSIPLWMLRPITPVTQYIIDGTKGPEIPWIEEKSKKSSPKSAFPFSEEKKHTLF